ncbi:MAG: hypothetical protein J6P19_02250 [Acetobacter sp.]|nr:hypothetical protein [Acetobacter sp.]
MRRNLFLPPPLKFYLGMSLAVSLSGCAGVNYGNYPTPNAQTCFINPTLVAAKLTRAL